MRKFTISVPTASDLGRAARATTSATSKAARATKTSISSHISKDERLANRVVKLKSKLDQAVEDFNASYKLEDFNEAFEPEVV